MITINSNKHVLVCFLNSQSPAFYFTNFKEAYDYYAAHMAAVESDRKEKVGYDTFRHRLQQQREFTYYREDGSYIRVALVVDYSPA